MSEKIVEAERWLRLRLKNESLEAFEPFAAFGTFSGGVMLDRRQIKFQRLGTTNEGIEQP